MAQKAPRRLRELKLGDASAVDLAMTFLEVNAMLFRSGYIKEELIQRLKGSELSAMHCNRLSEQVFRVQQPRTQCEGLLDTR
jgi:hypothetical protein